MICPSVVFMTLLTFSAYGFLEEVKEEGKEIFEEVEEFVEDHVVNVEIIDEPVKQPESKDIVITFIDDEEEGEEKKDQDVLASI